MEYGGEIHNGLLAYRNSRGGLLPLNAYPLRTTLLCAEEGKIMTLKQQRILGKIRSEIAIEELWEGYLLSIFKSSLFHNRRSKECNHGKQDANRAVFHNRREYFIEVHTLSLTIALCNQACEELLIQRLRSSVLTLSSKQALRPFETISNRVLAETAETRVLMPAVLYCCM